MATRPEDGMASLYRNLESSTGKSISEWIELARATAISKHKALVDHLKEARGLTHDYAHQIALRALAADEAHPADQGAPAGAQYQGAKSLLWPIYEAIASAASEFGPDVEFSPKKAYVSLRRTRQFAMVQPSTASRVDVGLILNGVPHPIGSKPPAASTPCSRTVCDSPVLPT